MLARNNPTTLKVMTREETVKAYEFYPIISNITLPQSVPSQIGLLFC